MPPPPPAAPSGPYGGYAANYGPPAGGLSRPPPPPPTFSSPPPPPGPQFAGLGGGSPFGFGAPPPPNPYANPLGGNPYGGGVADISDPSGASSSAKMEQTERQLVNASDRLTANTGDASAAFLARYRNGGVGRGRGLGGVQQGALGGAPLVDKNGNLI